jgi:hypothetical protein
MVHCNAVMICIHFVLVSMPVRDDSNKSKLTTFRCLVWRKLLDAGHKCFR